MRVRVLQHLMMWIVAVTCIALLVAYSIEAGSPGEKKQVEAVYAPQSAQTIYQDSSGQLVTYRRALAGGTAQDD